ncbi:MAG: hypothetical protein DRP11_03640 [Candidatus Aenigmatarchaeota archaeon]|nr:MAG: hypothetical protein DRP11_03640 [Candidatus Aenigmarchaeota archaeon]
MAKKNTLLYLDEDLVRMAKRMKVNISELAENALREKLLPLLSSSDRILFDIDSYLNELEKLGDCFFLSFPVKKVELKNIGPLDSFSSDFSSGINIIKGPAGSGKTTLLRSIVRVFGISAPGGTVTLKDGKSRGYIKVLVREGEGVFRVSRSGIERDVGSLLLDDPTRMLPSDKAKTFIKKLKGMYPGQIIMTMDRDMDIPNSKVIDISDVLY